MTSSLFSLAPLFFLALSACEGNSQLPSEPPTDATSQSLDRGDTVIGDVIFSCNRWVGDEGRPEAGRVLVDVVFNAQTADGPATREQEGAVLMRGGTVMYRYDAPVVRAEISTLEIPELVGGSMGVVNHVRSVPEPDHTHLEIILMYTRSVEESDITRIAQLGGRVRSIWTVINGLSAEIPDRSLSDLRSDPVVSHISLNNAHCLGL